ncbi:MAG: hypothetical protein AAGI25_13020 [Bacteroidota bacterium]
MEQPQFLPNNWTDGVKINKNHFFDSYFNTIENISHAALYHLTSDNYGLLEPFDTEKSNLDIDKVIHTKERVSLRLKACHAVTSYGFKIAFSSANYGENYPTATLESSNFDKNSDLTFCLLVVINPYNMVPVGTPDPEAIPLHHPHSQPKIRLEFVPQAQFNTDYLKSHYLMAGLIKWKSGSFVMDESYIPPVSRIRYHEKIHAFYEDIRKKWVELHSNCLTINKKILSKSASNKLAENTNILCNTVLSFISNTHFEFRQKGHEFPPIYLAEKISILSSHIITTLSCLPEAERESILQYFFEWTDVQPAHFEATLWDVMNLKYNHLEIAKTISQLQTAMGIISALFNKMSDLEYIGQRKDNIIISQE